MICFDRQSCAPGTAVSQHFPSRLQHMSCSEIRGHMFRTKRGGSYVVPGGPGPFEDQKTASAGLDCTESTVCFFTVTDISHSGPVILQMVVKE